MQKASAKGYSLGRRLVLVGALLAFMVLLPLVLAPGRRDPAERDGRFRTSLPLKP